MSKPTLDEVADHILDSIPYTDFEDKETGELRARPDTVEVPGLARDFRRVIDVVQLPEGAVYLTDGKPFLRITIEAVDPDA